MADKQPKAPVSHQPTEFVDVGEILGAWGLKGAFRVRSLTDFPERFNPGEVVYIQGAPHTILTSAWQKDGAIISINGIDTQEDAARLHRKMLKIPESSLKKLPAGTYYQFQIIGLEVDTIDGVKLGKITDILNCGNDVYVIKGESREILIPATRDVIKSIDLDKGSMVIEPIEGLLD
ncbi:MAG: ribosome maturation factor RimM [Dehalococcoidia bacterium]|nr:ribosome maturation factor RimM [Dehalococcoidia bacterium]